MHHTHDDGFRRANIMEQLHWLVSYLPAIGSNQLCRVLALTAELL
jgi:hypothetical protein